MISVSKNTSGIRRTDTQSIRQVREILNRQFCCPPTIAQLSKECCLSETKLKEGFRCCYGCTIYDYVIEKRMEYAYNILLSGQYKVKDAARRTGYSNVGHFIQIFRKTYGITPEEL